MKNLIFITILFFVLQTSCVFAQLPGWDWARNGLGNDYDQSSTVTTDINGNLIVAGYFTSDSMVFNNVILQNFAAGDADIFVACYDSSGNILWAQRIGGSGDDKAYALTTDALGNIYLSANFYSPVISVGTYTFNNAGNVGDILIVKFDNAGNILWATKEGGPGLEILYAIAVDNFGNIIVTGRFSSLSITFGAFTLTQAGSMDVFVVKYNSAGAVIWAVGAGGTSNDESYAIAVDANNDILVAGYFNGNAGFGSTTLSTNGSADIFLVKIEGSSGAFLWAKKFGGDTMDVANGLAIDGSNYVYITGFFQSTSVVFGSTTLINQNTAGSENSYITKCDNNGNVIWAHGFSGLATGYDICIYNSHIYTCGTFTDVSLSYGTSTLFENGNSDFYLAHCDTAGTGKWLMYYTTGGNSSDFALRISADPWGNVALAGYFNSDPLVFGPSSLSPENGFDMFIARLGSGTVGLNEAGVNVGILYPNPTSGEFIIAFSNRVEKGYVTVFSSNGRELYKETINNQTYYIAKTRLPPGMYVAKIYDGNHSIAKKIIIQ